MKRSLTALVLLTFLAGAFLGCSSVPVSTGLKIGLAGMARAADGGTVVTWRLANPNITSYLLAESSHRIYLNGTLVGTAEEREPVGVPPQQTVERSMRLKPAGGAADRVISDAIAAGSANYRLDSVITFRLLGEEVDKSKMSSSGTLPVAGK